MKGPDSFIFQYPHTKAVSSAYFSPCGRNILTTCYDDYVRVFDATKDSSAVTKIKHNNQTGRWVTNFKATWQVDGRQFVVGNMKRGLDVYDWNTTDRTYTHRNMFQNDFLTSIPAVNSFSPVPVSSEPVVASGNASGYVFVWYV